MLPSSIVLHSIPLGDTMGRLEREAAATLMVRACVLQGDRWQALRQQDIDAVIKHDLDNKLEPLWSLHTNPFWGPDFSDLVERGFARWTTGAAHAPIEFTDKGLQALRKYSRDGARAPAVEIEVTPGALDGGRIVSPVELMDALEQRGKK